MQKLAIASDIAAVGPSVQVFWYQKGNQRWKPDEIDVTTIQINPWHNIFFKKGLFADRIFRDVYFHVQEGHGMVLG